MELKIKNKKELDNWLFQHRNSSLFAIKGNSPPCSTYEDGSVILSEVNIAWQDQNTGEIFKVEYEE